MSILHYKIKGKPIGIIGCTFYVFLDGIYGLIICILIKRFVGSQILFLVSCGLSLLDFLIGWGLLKFKNWARILAIINFGFSITTGAFRLALRRDLWMIIKIAIGYGMILYLTRSKTKELFQIANELEVNR